MKDSLSSLKSATERYRQHNVRVAQALGIELSATPTDDASIQAGALVEVESIVGECRAVLEQIDAKQTELRELNRKLSACQSRLRRARKH